jgi:hypothetical protein
MNRILAASLMVVLVLAVSTAHASAGKLAQIRLQQQEIRKESERATGRYSRFDPAELQRLHRAQDEVFRLLNGVSELSQLNAGQQSELFNALETVKAVLSQNDGDRQVCWREKRLGSQRLETHCATIAERSQIRQGARDWHSQPSVCGQGSLQATALSCEGPIR